MHINEADCFDAPRPLVFQTLRDRYEEYLRYVPYVSSVRLVESEDLSPTCLRTVTEWRGQVRIPGSVKKQLKPEMIKWRIHSLWDERRWVNEWRMETFHFKNILECHGTLCFEEQGAGTRCALAALLRIDLPLIGPSIEKFIVKNYLNKSLMINNNAIKRLLREQGKCGA